MPTSVSYDLEMHDDLPEQAVSSALSPLEEQLKRIKYDPQRHAPRWARIGRYTNAPAAASAKMTLQRRHGSGPEVEGWRFETRRIDNGEATGLFAQYDGDKVVPGKKEENDQKYREFKARQGEARKARLAEQAKADAESHAKAQPVKKA